MNGSFTFVGRGLLGISRVPVHLFRNTLEANSRHYSSINRSLFTSRLSKYDNSAINPSRPFIHNSFMCKCEGTFSRRVYIEGDVVKQGVPTYTFFAPRTCLTFKVRKDEITGDPVLMLSGMSRETEGTGIFNKSSRTSSLLPLESLNMILDVLSSKSDASIKLEGTDNSEVFVSKTEDSFSIQLIRDPLNNLASSAMVLQASNNKPNIDFSGSSGETILLVHALENVLDHLSQFPL